MGNIIVTVIVVMSVAIIAGGIYGFIQGLRGIKV
jgi:hypothetical protein